MSYIQPWLSRLQRVGLSVGIAIEQVRQVAPRTHPQALGNPTDRDGGFGPKPGGQPHLERMALAPACELLLRNTVAAQRLGDKALRLGFSRFGKLSPVMPLPSLRLDVLEHFRCT